MNLGQAWHTHQQTVSAGEDGEQQTVDSLVLAHNHFPYLVFEGLVSIYETIEKFFI